MHAQAGGRLCPRLLAEERQVWAGLDVRAPEPCLVLRNVGGGQRAGPLGSEVPMEQEAELGKAVWPAVWRTCRCAWWVQGAGMLLLFCSGT